MADHIDQSARRCAQAFCPRLASPEDPRRLGLCVECAMEAAEIAERQAAVLRRYKAKALLVEDVTTEDVDRAASLRHMARAIRKALVDDREQGIDERINVTIAGSRAALSILARLADAQAAEDLIPGSITGEEVDRG